MLASVTGQCVVKTEKYARRRKKLFAETVRFPKLDLSRHWKEYGMSEIMYCWETLLSEHQMCCNASAK